MFTALKENALALGSIYWIFAAMEPLIELTPTAQDCLRSLESHLPHVKVPFLLETALALTLSLYEKSGSGASFTVTYADGRSEELRFKVKRPAKAKGKTKQGNPA